MKTATLCIYSPSSLIESIAERLGPDVHEMHFWALKEVVPAVAQWTRGVGPGAKPELYNRLRAHCSDVDRVLFTDDDIGYPTGFIPRYTAAVDRVGFDWAQPALTRDSYHTHAWSLARNGLLARETTWVEMMTFSMSSRLLRAMGPFEERFGMSWNLEMAMIPPLTKNGWRAGIIDALPVQHTSRPLYSGYGVDPKALFSKGAVILRRLGLKWQPFETLAHHPAPAGDRVEQDVSAEAAAFTELATKLGLRSVVSAILEQHAALICDPRNPFALFRALNERLALGPSGRALPGELSAPFAAVMDFLFGYLAQMAERGHEGAATLLARVCALSEDELLNCVLELYGAEVVSPFSRVAYSMGPPRRAATSAPRSPSLAE